MATRSAAVYLIVEEQLLEVPPMSTPNQTETPSQEPQLLFYLLLQHTSNAYVAVHSFVTVIVIVR